MTIGPECFCLIANQRGDGSLGEVFIHWGKHGTSSAGLVSAYAIALSAGLRHSVPLAELIRPGLDQDFVPNGRTDDPEIPRVRSVVDYVARRLAIDWLPYCDRAGLGVFTLAERMRRWERAAAVRVSALLREPYSGGWRMSKRRKNLRAASAASSRNVDTEVAGGNGDVPRLAPLHRLAVGERGQGQQDAELGVHDDLGRPSRQRVSSQAGWSSRRPGGSGPPIRCICPLGAGGTTSSRNS